MEDRPRQDAEVNYAIALMDATRKRGFDVLTAIMDRGYDGGQIHGLAMERGICPIVPIKDTERVKRGAAEPPHCVHGAWKCGGTDYYRKATKWRCPTGECKPASMWLKADRFHPLIPRDSKRYKDLYRKRGAVERTFGRLKHEWALLPLRVRGRERVQLHADLTILVTLVCRLATERAVAAAT